MSYQKNVKAKTSGQGKTHYSPYIKLRMNIKKAKKNEAFILIKKREKKLIKIIFILSKNNNLKEAAKNLYKTLRYN